MLTLMQYDIPDFTDDDLQHVLPGATLLEGISRYRRVKAQFVADLSRISYQAQKHLPARKAKLTSLPISTLMGDGKVPSEELDKIIAQLATIDAQIEAYCTGNSSKKMGRRYTELLKVHSELNTRVSVYKDNLGTNATVAMLLDNEEDNGKPDGQVEAQA